jgi:hypothetical protein
MMPASAEKSVSQQSPGAGREESRRPPQALIAAAFSSQKPLDSGKPGCYTVENQETINKQEGKTVWKANRAF